MASRKASWDEPKVERLDGVAAGWDESALLEEEMELEAALEEDAGVLLGCSPHAARVKHNDRPIPKRKLFFIKSPYGRVSKLNTETN